MTRKDWHGVLIFLGVAVFLSGALLIKSRLTTEPPYDQVTLCPKDRPLAAHTIVLVDRTDPITPGQTELLRTKILSLRDDLRQFELLSIVPITANSGQLPTLLFSLCNPGTGAQAKIVYQNPLIVQEKFQEKFGLPLENVLSGLMSGNTATESPIIETIRNLPKMDSFSHHVSFRRLIVFSDMLQNTKACTHYQENIPTCAGEIPDLTSVDVQVVYLARPRDLKHQGVGHREFWRGYFQRAGARSVAVEISSAEQ